MQKSFDETRQRELQMGIHLILNKMNDAQIK